MILFLETFVFVCGVPILQMWPTFDVMLHVPNLTVPITTNNARTKPNDPHRSGSRPNPGPGIAPRGALAVITILPGKSDRFPGSSLFIFLRHTPRCQQQRQSEKHKLIDIPPVRGHKFPVCWVSPCALQIVPRAYGPGRGLERFRLSCCPGGTSVMGEERIWNYILPSTLQLLFTVFAFYFSTQHF